MVKIPQRKEDCWTSHLIKAIAKKYAKMSTDERIKKIRKLVAKSVANRDFIRKFFPEFYQEAILTYEKRATTNVIDHTEHE